MDSEELKTRTKRFALRVMKPVGALPENSTGRAIASQLIRSGKSIGANYRSACRGRPKAEFLSKLQIVIEETDETCYWLELIIDGDLFRKERVQPLLDQANQITAIMVASRKTAQNKN